MLRAVSRPFMKGGRDYMQLLFSNIINKPTTVQHHDAWMDYDYMILMLVARW